MTSRARRAPRPRAPGCSSVHRPAEPPESPSPSHQVQAFALSPIVRAEFYGFCRIRALIDGKMTNGTRCVVVVDEGLAPGLAANAAAVMALTLGTKVPALVGDEFVDGAGERHPGLITTGLPVLRAAAEQLPALRARALEAEVGVIGFPRSGPTTTGYQPL